ncbi:hypothetical protein EYB53_011145 [Candidatus Chloroploca sp. M-50]|uniref:GIY-YIG domain-containing protein n=1 Tax=Candidatus Chloroploca mongolica TaxID=2528176 RepID=A0ABS4D9Z1_9CHLR|nr:hypothetical protein [Candidatus Chloroploca mongolica]MBP1466261.1 hypothetical protein [Candidatus Chloroploca mongolica]
MTHIYRNLDPSEAYAFLEADESGEGYWTFAGLIYDPLNQGVYRVAAPVAIDVDEHGNLSIPLPTLDNYPWAVAVWTDPVDQDDVTLLVEGPITEDNLWELCLPDEPVLLGELGIIDADTHWPEWAAAIRRCTAAFAVQGLDEILAALGFHPPMTAVVPAWKSGIYVLHLADDRYYVGQSVNLPARLAAHRRIYPDLHAVSLLKLRANQAELDLREQETIQILELQGFPLLNIVHASITHQSSPFDDLITPDAQQRWLASPLDLDHGVRPPVSPEQRMKQASKLKRLQQRPDADRLIACWRTYLTHCIPRPAATEPAYWSISCLPSTNISTSPRLACFNINVMEMFVVGYFKEDPRLLWAFLNVSMEGFAEMYAQPEQFEAAHPEASFEPSNYEAAGHDQLRLRVDGLDQLERLIADPGVQYAARLLNLHLMRKRTNLYARYHCYDLADLLLADA